MKKTQLTILADPDQELPYNIDEIRHLTETRVCNSKNLADSLDSTQILLIWDFFSGALKQAWPHAAELRWVHIAAAGVDTVLFDELRRSPVELTNAHGIFDRPIAEFVLASILAHDKQLYTSKSLQEQHIWRHRELTLTKTQNVLIIGTGGIGREVAKLLRAVGITVRGVGRTARDGDPDFDTITASANLILEVGWADHVVLAAPLTDQTRHLVDRKVLDAMKSTAHLINIGRGQLVNERDLVDALRESAIAAASLDVFWEEPLPFDSPLWTMSNVHISAHMCGDVTGWRNSLADQFLANLRILESGGEVPNRIDKQAGYLRT
ncbi:D-2-hydroxyacid dehydrogenase [Rhodococcus qingshengii]|uniref:D-2-hydroxyacid dehydrogenase n=1 Tax=Rhodococcus qingshengii TaxID=334542 RepID=UPI0035E28E89